MLKKNTLSSPAVTTQTVYADGPYDASTVLGTYGTPATGKPTQTEVVYLPTAGGPMPIAASIDGRLYAIHSDHLNTPRRLTQADGKVAWQWVTTAFGEVPPSTGATGFVQETSSAPKGAATTPPVKFDLRFPGQVADEESGLFYNFQRIYDPGTGRYMQNDPIGIIGGWNRYLYVGGNPLNRTDALGLCPMCLIPALPYVGELAIVGAAWWASQNTLQTKTPNRGDPGEWHTNPGNGQERLYGPKGNPEVDIDWHPDHGAGTPHGHNWDENGRGPGVPLSPWPNGRTPNTCVAK